MVTMQTKSNQFKFKTDKTQPKKKLPIKFNIGMLNMLIGYCFKKSALIDKKSILNLKRLMEIVDETPYKNDLKLEKRIEFINKAIAGRMEYGLNDSNPTILVEHCRNDFDDPETDEIISNLSVYTRISYEEIKYINKDVSDKLSFSFFLESKEKINEISDRVEMGMISSYKEAVELYENACKDFLNKVRKVTTIEDVNTISIGSDTFKEEFTQIVEKLSDPKRVLKTGIQCWNAMLGGGYRSKRVYTYCGLPAGFKSGILLKTANDIKKYNKHIPTKTPGARKTVLFVTMENTIEETVERLFNMNICANALDEFTPAQAWEMIRKHGSFTLDGEDDVDIVIKFFPINSIDTDDLYTIIEDMEDEGREVVALVLDYIKRIRPAEFAADEKGALKNISNELKNLAIKFDIPVITAHQLNRSAASTIDAGAESNKEDLTRMIGRSNIGSAWEVIENSDVVIIVNVEKKRNSEEYYLTFKQVKLRYRPDKDLPMGVTEMTYFNHPFASGNRVMLLDDVHLDAPISELSLATDFDGIDMSGKKGKKNAIERAVVASYDDDVFDFSKSINKAA